MDRSVGIILLHSVENVLGVSRGRSVSDILPAVVASACIHIPTRAMSFERRMEGDESSCSLQAFSGRYRSAITSNASAPCGSSRTLAMAASISSSVSSMVATSRSAMAIGRSFGGTSEVGNEGDSRIKRSPF